MPSGSTIRLRPRPAGGGGVDVDDVELVDDRVRARRDQLRAAVAGGGQGGLEDDLGAHPRELAEDLGEEAVVTDREPRAADAVDARRRRSGRRARCARSAATETPCGSWRRARARGRPRAPCCGSRRPRRARRPSRRPARARARPRSTRAARSARPGPRPRPGRRARPLLERPRGGREVELREHQQLQVPDRALRGRRLVGEALERRRPGRRRPERSAARRSRAVRTGSAVERVLEGLRDLLALRAVEDRLEGAVAGEVRLGKMSWLRASAGSRLARISFTPETGVT